MPFTVVGEDEDLARLSARLGRPGCMILRANGLFSEAWLTPGREILVPGEDFCLYDSSPCPVRALDNPARKAEISQMR